MSFTVVRGEPAGAQLYLDDVLDDILRTGKTRPGVQRREDVSLAEIIYNSLKKHPDDVRIINGDTGEKFTNERVLRGAVSVARALRAAGAGAGAGVGAGAGGKAVVMVRNHEHMARVYYGCVLAGALPFMMEPGSTEYEIEEFLRLVCPRVVFCEAGRRAAVARAAARAAAPAPAVLADGPSLDAFAEGQRGDDDHFMCPNVDPESPALLMPTSGSTGLPKAAILTHRGLTTQLPGPWLYHRQFPKPTRLALLLSTGQWMTHTITMTSCAVFRVPVLVTAKQVTTECVMELLDKYQPSWSFFGPSAAAALGEAAAPAQLAALDTVYLGGSPFAPESMASLKAKMSPSAALLNAYGLTEMQGLVSLGTADTPIASCGRIVNYMEYKLVDDAGEEVTGPNKKGELYLKSPCIFKGYLKNEAAYEEAVTSAGWLRTGDVFRADEEGRLLFVRRAKLTIKYLNHHIYPEELERVIGAVRGVAECAVVAGARGAAAAVVPRPGHALAAQDIHRAVESTLSEYKRLRGGVALVPALPRTASGKLRRAACQQMIQDLLDKGECF